MQTAKIVSVPWAVKVLKKMGYKERDDGVWCRVIHFKSDERSVTWAKFVKGELLFRSVIKSSPSKSGVFTNPDKPSRTVHAR